jgi:hypothetical protein
MLIRNVIKQLIELESIYGNVSIYYKDYGQNQAVEIEDIKYSKEFLIPLNFRNESKYENGIIIY